MIRGRHLLLVLALGLACADRSTIAQQNGCDPGTSEWSASRRLGSGGFYALAASGTRVHAFVGESPIRYARSLDEGMTFEPSIPLVSTGSLQPTGPAVAEGSNVYLVFFRLVHRTKDWCCLRDLGDLYIRRSDDGGATWQEEKRLTTSGSAFRYDLAVSGAEVHLVWSDYRANKWQLYYLHSLDHGATWTSETLLVSNPGRVAEINRPQIAANDSTVHVTWEDSRDNAPPCYTMPHCTEVYYKRSADDGLTWGRDTRLTHDGANASFRPGVASLGTSTILVSYQSDRDHNHASEQQVLRSDDNGLTWTGPTRLTFTPGASEHDTLIGNGSFAHLAWSEDTADGREHRVHYRAMRAEQRDWTQDEAVSCAVGGRWSVIADLGATTNYVHALFTDNAQHVLYARRPLKTLAVR